MEILVGVGFVLFMVAVFVLTIGGLVLWIYALVEVVRIDDRAYQVERTEKTTWVLIVVLTSYIGALIWWFGPRKRVKAAADSLPAVTFGGPYGMAAGPPPGWYPDPGGSGRARWWDGARWTEHQQ